MDELAAHLNITTVLKRVQHDNAIQDRRTVMYYFLIEFRQLTPVDARTILSNALLYMKNTNLSEKYTYNEHYCIHLSV